MTWLKGLVLYAALLDASGGARACGGLVLDALGGARVCVATLKGLVCLLGRGGGVRGCWGFVGWAFRALGALGFLGFVGLA